MALIALTCVIIVLLLSYSGTREDLILALFRIFVPLSFVGGLVGVVRATREWQRYGWQDRIAGLLFAGLFLMAWGVDAGRAAVRRTLSNAGYQVDHLEFNLFRVFAAALLVLAGLCMWRWVTRWPGLRRWRGIHLIGEAPWAISAVAWTAFVVFYWHLIERFVVWAYFW